jgi:hypothetical protein
MTAIAAKKRSFFNEDLDDLLEIKKYKHVDNISKSPLYNNDNVSKNINNILKNVDMSRVFMPEKLKEQALDNITKNVDNLKNEFIKFSEKIIDCLNKIDTKIDNLQSQINEIIYVPPKFNNECSYIN